MLSLAIRINKLEIHEENMFTVFMQLRRFSCREKSFFSAFVSPFLAVTQTLYFESISHSVDLGELNSFLFVNCRKLILKVSLSRTATAFQVLQISLQNLLQTGASYKFVTRNNLPAIRTKRPKQLDIINSEITVTKHPETQIAL